MTRFIAEHKDHQEPGPDGEAGLTWGVEPMCTVLSEHGVKISPTWTGMVYVAFVVEAYSRRIVGWRTAKSMTTAVVLDALEHALFTRAREGVTDLTGLVSHSDAWPRRPWGPFKNELIRRQGPWRDVDHVELGTAEWVTWFNTERPHNELDDFTPEAVEKLHYAHRNGLPQAG